MQNDINTTTYSAREEYIAIQLIGILYRRNPAKTGEEALKRLVDIIRSDCGCLDFGNIKPYYQHIATEAGIDPDEVWRLVSSLHPSLSPENRPSPIAGEVLLKMFDTIDPEDYKNTM